MPIEIQTTSMDTSICCWNQYIKVSRKGQKILFLRPIGVKTPLHSPTSLSFPLSHSTLQKMTKQQFRAATLICICFTLASSFVTFDHGRRITSHRVASEKEGKIYCSIQSIQDAHKGRI
jgi:hypothetical protein